MRYAIWLLVAMGILVLTGCGGGFYAGAGVGTRSATMAYATDNGHVEDGLQLAYQAGDSGHADYP